ncbi:MAG: carbohydrate binding family 9 domain-containing protein [Ferruginibacter sp.]|nr:carbohydrate binding family 9 domain-containing protein [Ferruginibacter sp.]
MRKIYILFTVLFFLLAKSTLCQLKNLEAVKITSSIKIDGNLTDEGWANITPATDFVTAQPVYGNISINKTEVKIVYDNYAVYIGAYLYCNPKDIKQQLTERDKIDRQDVDIFTLGFDTYQDRQNAFVFRVTAAGVQADARLSNGGVGEGGYDSNWDAVWESKVNIKADGWVAEIKIPFSAIRFSKNKIQNWGLNFARLVRSQNELSIWSPINPNVAGDVNQWGNWNNLKDIKPPLRLSFSPYLSGGIRVSPTMAGSKTEYLKSGGMDIKYGINESFTLDMTLIPDFAQVQSDNVFLNLQPFKVKFDEYRQFFTEGTELFNKAGLFYSRRIGDKPSGANDVSYNYDNNPNYRVNENPGITRLYNATKISGRNKNNLGIGFFNAITAPMYAKITNLSTQKDSSILTEPLTNYNIIVFDKAFKNRSYLSFTNTNVMRKGNSRNANVTGVDFGLFDKKNEYSLTLSTKYSNIWGSLAKYDGYKTELEAAKISGNVRFNTGLNIESEKYDPNDLGYIQNPNAFEYFGSIGYYFVKPTKNYLQHNYQINIANSHLYKPFKWTKLEVEASAFFLFKNFWDLRLTFVTAPAWSNDYFINNSSYNGNYLKRSPFYYLGLKGSTDSRKKLFVNYSIGGAESPLPKDPYWQGSLGVRYRFSNKFQLTTSMDVEQDRGSWGWAFMNDASTGKPIIARRNSKKNIGIISGQYSFTKRMNLTVRLRHFWNQLANTNFYDLKTDGYWTETTFIPNKDINFNTFNIDMFYTWDFLLGSRITLGWKNALGGTANIDAYNNRTYTKNFSNVLNSPHSNEVTLKVVYFLDYLMLKRK